MLDGSIVPTGDRESYEYWVGTTYYLAAMMYRSGLTNEALNTAYGAYYPVYVANNLAYWFNTPEAWRDGGYSPRPHLTSTWSSDHMHTNEKSDLKEVEDAPIGNPNQYQRPMAVWELMFEIKNGLLSYLPGDVNDDGTVDIADIIFLVNYLYRFGPPPSPIAAGDTNCDGVVQVGDIISLIDYLFKNGLPPCQY
jgi:hypothetical protein